MIAFFFKSLCSQQPHRCYTNDLLTSRVIVRRLFGPPKIVLRAFFKFDNTKKRPKSFFLCESLPFLNKLVLHQPLRSYRNKLITCTINVERLFGPYKLFSDFYNVRYYEKKWATSFISLESLLLFREFMFSTTS